MNGWGRRASWVAVLTSLVGLGCATAPFEAGCSSRAGSRTSAPLMWRVQERVAGGGIFYLLGSIHFETENAPQFPSEIEAAYTRSDELVVEVDLSDATDPEVGADGEERGRLEPPTQLADVLSPLTLEQLERYLDERGLPFSLVAGRKPWYITNFLVVLELLEAGYDAEYGVDRQFIERSSGKPVVALETVAEQSPGCPPRLTS